MRAALLIVAGFVTWASAGCGGDKDKTPPATEPQALLGTLEALAAMGEKQPGTPAGQAAADYIKERFAALKLSQIREEAFQIPRWQVTSKVFAVTFATGQPMSYGFDVFECSGGGKLASAAIVDVGTATDSELAGKDVAGKIALVTRKTSFHRSAQYRNVTKAGAAAMLYVSTAPQNLRQVGSVRFDWEAAGAIPAVTIGADDAAQIQGALANGTKVTARIEVEIATTPAVGKNIVATIPGERPEKIVLGAHYDTWFTGSSDNGSGVAELIAFAERRMKRGKPRYTIELVAFDGEETGLYGGYDYLRKHKVIANDPILAVINFESPSAIDPEIAGLVRSNQPVLDSALKGASLGSYYGLYAGLELVAQIFGGVIPTDIQGLYRSGVPTVTTAVTNAYYHTAMDTPDKVDLELLAASTDSFENAVEALMKVEPAEFAVVDRELWTADATATPGANLVVEATIRTGTGEPAANAQAAAALLYDDFFQGQTPTLTAKTDANGRVQFTFPAGADRAGSGNRFVHIGVGPEYPLVEKIVALP